MLKTTLLCTLVCVTTGLLTAAQPLAEYAFEGNTGNGKIAGKVRYESGVKGQAIVLADSTVTVPVPANLSTAEGTITFWFKPINWDTDSAEFMNLIASNNAKGDGRLHFYKYSKAGGLGLMLWYGNPNERTKHVYATDCSRQKLTKGTWYHCAMTWSKKKHLLALFFNGDMVASNGTTDAMLFESFGPFILNSWPYRPYNRANETTFDQLKFFSQAYPTHVIRNMYNREKKTLKSATQAK